MNTILLIILIVLVLANIIIPFVIQPKKKEPSDMEKFTMLYGARNEKNPEPIKANEVVVMHEKKGRTFIPKEDVDENYDKLISKSGKDEEKT